MVSQEMNLRQSVQASSSLLSATRSEERFAAGFAMIAGFVDAYAYLHYKIYVSFMSGNTTTVGSMTGQGDIVAMLPSLAAIVFYVVGVFSGTLLANVGLRQLHRLLFGLIAFLLAVVVVMSQINTAAAVISIALLCISMGLLNTTLSHIGAQSVNLVFMTGTLSRMAMHLALAMRHAPAPIDAQGSWDTHFRRAFLLMGVWASFLVGALLGGLVTTHFGAWILLIPALILATLVVSNYIPE